jgi:DNA helicase-2/ATP-dependent DNA helicase PcrA
VTPDQILAGLNEAQREAATATTGPVAILAGAGTGKTRVISHRVAYAIATGVVPPSKLLLVTFTEKAAAEMVERVARMGLTGASQVAARTFHAAALAQLRYYWPLRHDGEPLPDVLSDKWRIVAPLARRLPGGYKFTPTKDLIDEIEWAKSRRLKPDQYEAGINGRTPPVPVDLFTDLYRNYERAKTRQRVIDFDDMLTFTVELLENDEDAARQVRGRYSWFSVDEYQDTSPLQQRLLELWLGDRRDLCVVGDEDQTIYTFAGATPTFLTGFSERYPDARVIPLLENYRSTPQVLELANRLIASTGRSKRLEATRPVGPAVSIRSFPTGEAELDEIVRQVRRLVADGVKPAEIAVLVRLNAQIPEIEAAFTRAGIGYRVRGQRFFDRRDVRGAIEELRRVKPDSTGLAMVEQIQAVWSTRLGFDPAAQPDGAEARERQAALATLLGIISDHVQAVPAAGRDQIVAALADRAEAERSSAGDGVELSTLHRAKGLEWDAVFLPSLEEGLLPVSQARDDEDALAEERRLLYVGITRARVHLALSWAMQRASTAGKSSRRQMSRFLRHVAPMRAGETRRSVDQPRAASPTHGSAADDDPLFIALKDWRRERAKSDGVPAYVIAHDSTLRGIAEARPRSIEQLGRVPGIGQARLTTYGAEVIATVARARP